MDKSIERERKAYAPNPPADPCGRVRLRLINAASATQFWIDQDEIGRLFRRPGGGCGGRAAERRKGTGQLYASTLRIASLPKVRHWEMSGLSPNATRLLSLTQLAEIGECLCYKGQAGAEEGLAMVDHHHWQLDGSAPELYEKYLVPAITTKWADDLVGRAQPGAGEEVLDVACGTGVVARSASRRMLHGHITGLDLNKGMLTVARTQVSEGAPIDWIEGSALDLPFPAEKFDLVLCQLGLQFFPDQGRALREMRRVLSSSGRVALSVYSPIERTPGANAFVLALDRVLGPNASKIKRGEHSFNAPDELRELLMEAGFAKVEVQTVVQQIAFPSVLDYVRFQLLATPMAALLSNRDEADRQAAIKTIASETASFCDRAVLEGGGFSFRQEAYVGTGHATS